MARETELYRLELEEAAEVFGNDKFLTVSELSRRIGCTWEATRKLFAGEDIPPVGISKARYALALSRNSIGGGKRR